jgi:hypothetical protein
MRRTPTLAVSVFVLTAALGLAGCASESSTSDSSSSDTSSPSDSSSPTESSAPSQPAESAAVPATGAIVVGDGYSFTAPAGWGEQDNSVAPGTDTVAVDSAPTGPFASNVNVVLSPAGAFTPDEVEQAAGAELETSGATDVSVLDRLTVAGTESAHITAVMNISDLTYRIHQYYVTNEDQTYIITFSTDEAVADADATGIAESVLATWTWA